MASEIVKIPLDKFGRVVLPKPLRQRLGLSAGTEFEVEEQADAIVLKPIAPRAELIDKDGWLIVRSERPLAAGAIQEAIDSVRARRSRTVGGF